MALISLEQRRQRERADEQANRIRQELAEYDLAHSSCPVDRRRAEKEAERKALEAREAEQSQQTTNWMAWIDNRIMQYLDHYCLHVFEHDENDKLSIMTASLAEVIHLERVGRRKEVADAIEELERRLAGKLVELREHLHQSTPGKFPVVKTWREESVVYQGELVSHRGSLWQAQRDTAQAPGGSDWACVARRGRDAITPSVRGNYDVHDIVKTAIEDARATTRWRSSVGLTMHPDTGPFHSCRTASREKNWICVRFSSDFSKKWDTDTDTAIDADMRQRGSRALK